MCLNSWNTKESNWIDIDSRIACVMYSNLKSKVGEELVKYWFKTLKGDVWFLMIHQHACPLCDDCDQGTRHTAKQIHANPTFPQMAEMLHRHTKDKTGIHQEIVVKIATCQNMIEWKNKGLRVSVQVRISAHNRCAWCCCRGWCMSPNKMIDQKII